MVEVKSLSGRGLALAVDRKMRMYPIHIWVRRLAPGVEHRRDSLVHVDKFRRRCRNWLDERKDLCCENRSRSRRIYQRTDYL